MGAGPSHDLAACDGLVLRCGRRGVEVGEQFGSRQRFAMAEVCIECVDQGRAFLHDPHAGMFVSVNVPLVSLRQPKPAFQVEVVAWLVGILATHEQADLKTGHDLAHLLLNQIVARSQLVTQGLESLRAFGTGTAGRFQGFLDGPDGGDVALDRLQVVLDLVQSTVDAASQALELALSAPPFLTWMFRSSDCRTSRNASAIRRPGGCSGPPWSSLRIPFTAVQ